MFYQFDDAYNKLKIIWYEWDTLTPRRKWDFFLKIGDVSGRAIGVNIFSSNKLSRFWFIPLIAVSLYYLLVIYTIVSYAKNGHFADGISCLSLSGICISASITYYVSITNPEDLHKVYTFAYDIYFDDPTPTPYNKICSKNIGSTFKKLRILFILIIISLIASAANPAYIYFRDGIMVTLTGVLIPFVEKDSTLETFINWIYQIITAYIGFCSMVATQMGITILNNNNEVSADLTIFEIQQLSKYLECERFTKNVIRNRLSLIFRQINCIDDFILGVSDLLYWYFFVSPLILSYGIGVCIYAQRIMNFPSGYGIGITSYVIMILLCHSGETIINRNDRICDALHIELKWHLLPIKYQRDVVQIINHMQNGPCMSIGPFQLLNYQTAKELTLRVHTFLMFLLNFAE